MGLGDDAAKLASALSGGMRRRLSLACALVGNSKVVILDEPTVRWIGSENGAGVGWKSIWGSGCGCGWEINLGCGCGCWWEINPGGVGVGGKSNLAVGVGAGGKSLWDGVSVCGGL